MNEVSFALSLLKIPVSDVTRSAEFYRTALGFEEQFVAEKYGWAQLQAGDRLGAGHVAGPYRYHTGVVFNDYVMALCHVTTKQCLHGGASTQQQPKLLVTGFRCVGCRELGRQHFPERQLAGAGRPELFNKVRIMAMQKVTHNSQERMGMTELGGAAPFPVKEGLFSPTLRRWYVPLVNSDLVALATEG